MVNALGEGQACAVEEGAPEELVPYGTVPCQLRGLGDIGSQTSADVGFPITLHLAEPAALPVAHTWLWPAVTRSPQVW